MNKNICIHNNHQVCTIFIVMTSLPVFPNESVTLHVCTPASRDLNILSVIVCDDDDEEKQLPHVEDQR